jgi:hypothetical protein
MYVIDHNIMGDALLFEEVLVSNRILLKYKHILIPFNTITAGFTVFQ